jgi:hypothetical protein
MREQQQQKRTAMFEQENRPQQQISRDAAERYALMVAIVARKAQAKPLRQQRRAVRRTRASVAKPAR